MAIINSYPLATPKLTDLVLGTSTSSSGQTSTKSFTVQSIRDATSGVKTIITTTPTTLSITGTTDVTINTITAAVTDGGTGLATGNDIYDFVVGKITGTANTIPVWTTTTTLGDSLISQAANGIVVNGNSTDGKLTLNCSAGTHGVTLQSPPHSAAATYTWILPQSAGTAGQVLTSGGGATDQLTWSTNGNVGGTGTTNKLSKWSNANTLADSNVEDTGTLVTISSAAKVTGNLELDADLLDVNGATGTAGQLLSSLGTGNGVDWIDAPATGVLSVATADANVITIGGTASNPTIDANTAAVTATSDNLATGAQIQTAINSALAGAITFKGTFNANTGQITGGSDYLYNPGANSNTIAVAVGDMYVVSVAGNFFGNSSTALNVGDEVIAVTQSTIGPSNSQESYYNAVPSQSAGGTVTTFSTVSTAYPGITTTVTNPTTTPELTLGLGTNAAAGKYLDGGTGDWVTLPAGDTYTLQAGAKAGSSVPLQLDAAAGSDSTVNLTEGTGITLTQTSSSEITIDAAGGGGGTKTVATVASVAAGVSTHALGVTVTTTPLVNYVDLYISGVYQSKTSYTVSGSTLTLTGTTFPTGALIETVTTT
tara:strand:- start:457 stop:2253 length:1797 start_codon:yes stop_codon:yes gene_type:complete